MKILHTSDWHIGKVLKGQSRLAEQIAALHAVVQIAQTERPDLILVAGDLYETATPTAEATKIVTRALSALRDTGADVIVIAGNHDNGAALDALRAWADKAGIVLRGRVSENPDEHIIAGSTAGGESWRCIALPFLSQRYAVRALDMFSLTEAQAQATYADHLARLLDRLAADAFAGDESGDQSGDQSGDEPGNGTVKGTARGAVNLVMAHVTVVGGVMGGGERDAHSVLGYVVPSTIFPAATHYVALGHLHRAQSLPGPCPVRYSGSPIAIDFGEEANTPSVTIVEVTADTAAKVRACDVPATAPLRTLRGNLAELTEAAAKATAEEESGERGGESDRAWLRIYVNEPPRAGLREQVQDLFPNALEIRIDPALLQEAAQRDGRAQREGRSPSQLFGDYLTGRGHADPATQELFDRLYAEVTE